jgi:hypothetical protein
MLVAVYVCCVMSCCIFVLRYCHALHPAVAYQTDACMFVPWAAQCEWEGGGGSILPCLLLHVCAAQHHALHCVIAVHSCNTGIVSVHNTMLLAPRAAAHACLLAAWLALIRMVQLASALCL